MPKRFCFFVLLDAGKVLVHLNLHDASVQGRTLQATYSQIHMYFFVNTERHALSNTHVFLFSVHWNTRTLKYRYIFFCTLKYTCKIAHSNTRTLKYACIWMCMMHLCKMVYKNKKRPTIEAKEAYYRGKRDLLLCKMVYKKLNYTYTHDASDVTLCMMMWHYVWWCDTMYDDVTLCMMMWQQELKHTYTHDVSRILSPRRRGRKC
jgi:hypothetical protein